MKIHIPALLFCMLANLLTMHTYAQNDKSAWGSFIYSSSATNKQESKEITSLRSSFQQLMLTLSSSSRYNFNGLRSASSITIGSSEEESLQYLVESSYIIRMELVEKLPEEILLDELRNYNRPVSTSKQGMILGLRKDLNLFRVQIANSR